MLKAISDTQERYMGEGKKKQEKVLPRFTVLEDDLPEMDDWEIGKKYKLEIEVEFVAHKKGSEYDFETDKKNRGTFKIHALGVAKEKEETFEQEYARRRSKAGR